jgi:hypothetical protein
MAWVNRDTYRTANRKRNVEIFITKRAVGRIQVEFGDLLVTLLTSLPFSVLMAKLGLEDRGDLGDSQTKSTMRW